MTWTTATEEEEAASGHVPVGKKLIIIKEACSYIFSSLFLSFDRLGQVKPRYYPLDPFGQ